MAKTKAPTTITPQTKRTLEKRIGHTTYEVHICFNEQSKESMNDKICALLKIRLRIVSKNCKRQLASRRFCDILVPPQMSWLSRKEVIL